MAIRVYDSLTRQTRPFEPRVAGRVSIYTCGVTPYDQSHVGHARPAVVWDAIRRHLMRRGYLVTFVQNFTDIDDKLIRRAAELGRPVEDLARQFILEYDRLMEQLSVMPPDFAPQVTENIDTIVAYIQRLVDGGGAYAAEGSVYFRVKSDPEYGKLSGRKLDEMLEGVRVELEPEKEYPGDFALWKAARPGEPAWPSPWGEGRPGWHIECSAMSQRYLGDTFDMHGGGMDLLFPHHENERAQSRAYLGHEAVNLWVHNGLITRGGVKMSKSLKNGITMAQLLERYSGHVLRTYLLSVHYRKPLDFEGQHLDAWQTGLERIYRLWQDVEAAPAAGAIVAADWVESLIHFEERFLAAMDDDFNTAKAFGELFDMVTAAHRGIDAGYADLAKGLARRNLLAADQVLRFLPDRTESGDGALAEVLLTRRNQARKQKNFALADALRDTLIEAGYEVLDGADGTRIHRLPQ